LIKFKSLEIAFNNEDMGGSFFDVFPNVNKRIRVLKFQIFPIEIFFINNSFFFAFERISGGF
jgi:hypothetical protein